MITWFRSLAHEKKPSMTGALIGAVAGLPPSRRPRFRTAVARRSIGVLAALFATRRSSSQRQAGTTPSTSAPATVSAAFLGTVLVGVFRPRCETGTRGSSTHRARSGQSWYRGRPRRRARRSARAAGATLSPRQLSTSRSPSPTAAATCATAVSGSPTSTQLNGAPS